jgi:hypothetical protein
MFSIDNHHRLFVKNQTLILTEGNVLNFLIGKARIQINVLSKQLIQCSLNRFNPSIENDLIGFIEILNTNQKRSFYLLNYNDLFLLDHEYGFLRYRNQNQMIIDDLILLIEVENSRCLVKFHGLSSIPYMMIRKGDHLEINKLGNTKKVNKLIEIKVT